MTETEPRLPAWLAPQVIVAVLLFIAALVFAFRGPDAAGRPPTVTFDPIPQTSGTPTEVEIAVLEATGLERIAFVEVVASNEPSERFVAIFGALREALVEAGVWPAAVGEPRIFVQRVAGRDVIVMDLDVPPEIAVDVEAELRIVGSIDATASRHDAVVRYLVNGQPTETLLGHVAVPSVLTRD